MIENAHTLVESVMKEAAQAAAKATSDYIAKNGHFDCCGFAWVKIYEKGSTKLGKALIKAGFDKAYGGGLDWWNPSAHHTQSLSAKEAGAEAAARVMSDKLDLKFYMQSRMD